MKFQIYYCKKAADLLCDLIETEELENVEVEKKSNAVGDTMLVVTGDEKEVNFLRAVFKNSVFRTVCC